MKQTAIVLSLLLVMASPALAQSMAQVTAVSGTAEVVRGGKSQAASAGLALEPGDSLKTGPDGQMDISANGLAGARFLGATEASLTGVEQASMSVTVATGNVVLNLKDLPPGSAFRLETPTAIAAVRGTQFWGRVDAAAGAPATTLAVREGSVEVTVKASGASHTVAQGQALDIPMGPATPTVRAALEEEMAAMAQASDIPIV